MKTVFHFGERLAPFFLRFSLALILLWIGALKFIDPTPVRMLLHASLPFLAFNAFVYVLGALEILAAGCGSDERIISSRWFRDPSGHQCFHWDELWASL